MKQNLLLLFLSFCISPLFAQNSQWTWIKGDTLVSQYAIYGSKGTAAATNKPGARQYASTWTDASGNLWLFGGTGDVPNNSGPLSDLWKYAPSTAQWTWMSGDSLINQAGVYGIQGVPAFANKPGARFDAVSWRDASDNLWLFGGNSYTSNGENGLWNDLWKFTPSTGQWTWISGDNTPNSTGVYGIRSTPSVANKPGARQGAISWIDNSGNLWIFGGTGYTNARSEYGTLNDLWKYTPSTGQWTWIGGDIAIEPGGIYGIKGTAAINNKPGARYHAAGWSDASGNLWLFGGFGWTTNRLGSLNDLWKYVPSSGQWTWMSGDNLPSQLGVYGTKNTSAPNNKPGGRESAASWSDAFGNLWLFGGFGYAASNTGSLNDLWKYAPSTGQWTWTSGDNTPNQSGVYGTQGTAAETNKPGARQAAVSWTDASGKLWLFGGNGYAANGTSNLNDLWQYATPATSLPVQFSSFTAQRKMQTIALNWTTAQEQNSQYFIVERSSKDIVFDSIGNVAAMGTSFSTTNYSYIDKAPLPGNNFYRLKQVDKDGRFLYTGIAKVVMDEDTYRFVIMQNPVQNTLQLNMQLPAARKLSLQIRDITGHLLLSEEKLGSQGTSVYSFPVERLTRGTYFINIQTGNVSNTKTFIKK